ncbi:methyl-accepting chemotaxis protein [Terriglobus albidus]|uniref:methyl-accepting chemotaxis protein n=1 Tax=Terriglobus albidus TaxID=1592106 RepID=UPI0021E03DB7|nr:methyl-accepting chemotaxis protein [Terriglobus albidus]
MKDLTIKQKLLSATGALTLLVAVLGVAFVYRVSTLGDTIQELGLKDAQKFYLAGLADAAGSEMLAAQRGELAQAALGNWTVASKRAGEYAEHETALRKSLKSVREIGVGGAGAALLDKTESTLDRIDPIFARFNAAVNAHDLQAAQDVNLNQLVQPLEEVDNISKQLLEHQKDIMAEANQKAHGAIVASDTAAWTLLFLALGVAGVVTWVVIRLERELRKNVLDLNQGAEQIASAASQISSSSQNLARDSSEQAAMIEETSASSEEISSMAKRNADNARAAMGIVGTAVSTSQQSAAAVKECVNAMTGINESSQQIAKIISVIDKISFQTNILALNAAVEAARAGEAGAGFAVVAEEVRNLAQRSAEAAHETSALIGAALTNAEDGRHKIESLVQAGSKLEGSFAEIKSLVDQIGDGSSEQVGGVGQIAHAISRMESVTQKNASNAEESAAAAEQLNAQSGALHELAARLGAMVGLRTSSRREVQRGAERFSIKPDAKPVAKAAKAMMRPVAVPIAAGGGNDANFVEF